MSDQSQWKFGASTLQRIVEQEAPVTSRPTSVLRMKAAVANQTTRMTQSGHLGEPISIAS
jgi:hypothetical protein